jgi:hypothetical protein
VPRITGKPLRVLIGRPGPVRRKPDAALHELKASDLRDCHNPECRGRCVADLPRNMGTPMCCHECGLPLIAYSFPHEGLLMFGCPACVTNCGEVRLPEGVAQ